MKEKTPTVTVKIKGYKKFCRKVREMREEIEQLNASLEKTVELKEKLF